MSDSSVEEIDKEVDKSIKKSYDLYFFLLQLPKQMAFLAQKELDSYEEKLLKSHINISPIFNLANQEFPEFLYQNEVLLTYSVRNSIFWTEYPEILQKIYSALKTTDFFGRYIGDNQIDFDIQKTFWKKFFKSSIIFDENFEDFLESLSIYWNDDLSLTLSFVEKTISQLTKENITTNSLLPLYKNEEDKKFVKQLTSSAVLNSARYEQIIEDAAKHWDLSRMSKMDIVLLKLAIAEIETFPTIPISVTIDEYIEISKYYSTNKSKTFINGILEKIVRDMKENGTLNKIDTR